MSQKKKDRQADRSKTTHRGAPTLRIGRVENGDCNLLSGGESDGGP